MKTRIHGFGWPLGFLLVAMATACGGSGQEDGASSDSAIITGPGTGSGTGPGTGSGTGSGENTKTATADVTTTTLTSGAPCTLDVEAPVVDAHSPGANAAIAKGLPARTQDMLCGGMGPTDTVVIKSRYEVVTNTRGILTIRTTSSGTLNDKPLTVLGPVSVNSFDLQTGKPLTASDVASASGVKKISDACVSALTTDFVNAVSAADGKPPGQAALDLANSTNAQRCDLALSNARVGSFSIEESGVRLVLVGVDTANPVVTALVPWSDLAGTLQGVVADFAKGGP